MNLVDAYVIEVLDPPYEAHGYWWVNVLAVSWGHEFVTQIMCKAEAEALAIGPDYKFQC